MKKVDFDRHHRFFLQKAEFFSKNICNFSNFVLLYERQFSKLLEQLSRRLTSRRPGTQEQPSLIMVQQRMFSSLILENTGTDTLGIREPYSVQTTVLHRVTVFPAMRTFSKFQIKKFLENFKIHRKPFGLVLHFPKTINLENKWQYRRGCIVLQHSRLL